MKRLLLSISLLIVAVAGQITLLNASGLKQGAAPTLVPPTLVPQQESGIEEILPSESTVARIQANGKVRVGILYNAPPFGELNIRGEHAGFDADLARSMAETWGVEVEFVQVTRQFENTVHLLRTGQIDMLLAAQVHRRELGAFVEFSHTYYMGAQAMMVRQDDTAMAPAELAGRRIGFVIASPAQNAVNNWMARNSTNAVVSTYLTLDRAYVALVAGEVDAIVDSDYRLRQVSLQQPELTRVLDTPIEQEPFAVAVLRQDVSMRDLVNRTLQYLVSTGRLNEIHQVYFPGSASARIRIWDNLGEEKPSPAQYSPALVFPQEYIVPRIQTNGVIRVAGLYGVTADSDSPQSERRLDTFHRNLLSEMASRWVATIEYIPDSHENALELVASGQADLAVGTAPDWAWADRVDFTSHYLLHGERMMVRVNDNINSFIDFQGGGLVITPSNEPTAAQRLVEIAEMPGINARVEVEQRREEDLGFSLLADEELEADAVFGDSLKLIPHVQAAPLDLKLTLTEEGQARWYSPSNMPDEDFAARIMVFAVPRNDIDFRLLVNYTLQEIARDGTLNQLLQPVMLPDEIPAFDILPGPSTYLGISLRK